MLICVEEDCAHLCSCKMALYRDDDKRIQYIQQYLCALGDRVKAYCSRDWQLGRLRYKEPFRRTTTILNSAKRAREPGSGWNFSESPPDEENAMEPSSESDCSIAIPTVVCSSPPHVFVPTTLSQSFRKMAEITELRSYSLQRRLPTR